MRRQIRLIIASIFGPSIGEWSERPFEHNGETCARRLMADGTYDYRLMTSEEQAEWVSSEAW